MIVFHNVYIYTNLYTHIYKDIYINLYLYIICMENLNNKKVPCFKHCMRQDGCIITIAFGIKAKEGRLLLRHCVCIKLSEHSK